MHSTTKYSIFVLDTDYENFTVVYGCYPESRRHHERDELILIHSRHYRLSKTVEFVTSYNGMEVIGQILRLLNKVLTFHTH